MWVYKTADFTTRNTIFEKTSKTTFEDNVTVACYDNSALLSCSLEWKTLHSSIVSGDTPSSGSWVNVIFISRDDSNTTRHNALYING
mmetsp:Transcript_26909/g.4910  ORF Transcript_26909/g.4910 Transcript_26909/m.4910 type:complete len:87 (+) Transcript_26909:1501-1761(+)